MSFTAAPGLFGPSLERVALIAFLASGRRNGIEAAIMPACCSTWDQINRLAACSPFSMKDDNHLLVTDNRTADATTATIPIENIAVNSMRLRTGIVRRLRKNGSGKTHRITSVVRLKEALNNHRGIGLRQSAAFMPCILIWEHKISQFCSACLIAQS